MFINQTARFGGAERVLMDLLTHIDQTQFEPILVSPKGELQEAVEDINIKHVEVNEFLRMETTRKNFKGEDLIVTYRLFNKINQIINDYKPDLIYTNSVKAHILVNLRSRKIPTFIRLHDFPQSFGGVSKKLLKHSLKRARYVSCVSKSVSEDVKSLMEPLKTTKVEHTYNGYLKRTVKIQQHFKKRIVIAGWLQEWKGFDVFVEAMEQIADQIPDWEFVIAGDVAKDAHGSKEYAERLKKRISNSIYADRFIMQGSYKDLSEVACCAEHTIFVQASIKPDPLPTVLLEASGIKLPIVCSNLGGSTEIIADGKTGFVVSPSASEIAEKVYTLAVNPGLREAMGQHAQQDCNQKFNMNKYIDGMTDKILKLTKR